MSNALKRLAFVLMLVFVAVPGGLLIGPQSAGAQPAAEISLDYKDWEETAQRAEDAIEAGRASTMALEELRTQLTDWRARFDSAQAANRRTISTVLGQLEALGPPPESGEESAEIAVQRDELNRRLAELRAPVKTAELAYSRADGLIKGIDEIVRDRQAEKLLEFGPSPINPIHWGEALKTLTHSLEAVREEFERAWGNPVQRDAFKQSVPVFILLMIIGLVLVFRGRIWSRRLTNRVLNDQPGAGRWLAAFVLSTGSLFLPLIGVVALIEGAFVTDLVGLRSEKALSGLAIPAFIFLTTRWLATRIFPAKEARTLPLCLDAGQRATGRWYGAILGLVAASYFYVSRMSSVFAWSEATTNVILFGFIVLSGLLMLRISQLLHVHVTAMTEREGEENFRSKVMRFLALGLSAVAIIAPILAAVGYFTLARFVLFPTLASLLLMAALLVLQRLVTEVYVLLSRNREGAAESLFPELAGFALVILSLPIFALIWGARVTDLLELWKQFNDGISLGDTQISPTIFLTLAVVFTLGFLATRLLQGALKISILPKTKLDAGGRNAIVSGVGYVGIFLAALIAITSAGIDLSSLAIVAGALSVGIGFGLQNIVSNFVSGIILLIERPISEGDWIEVGGQHGYVRSISVRSTRIETFDRTDVIVPNADFVSGTVTNYTRGNTVGRVIVPVGVAYGTDTRKVEQILKEIGEAHPMVLASPPPNVIFRGFGADSLDFEIRAILRDVNWVMSVHSDMNHEIARRFTEEGIEIPFAQRDVWLRNPEALTGQRPQVPAESNPDSTPPKDPSDKGFEDAPESDAEGEADGGDR